MLQNLLTFIYSIIVFLFQIFNYLAISKEYMIGWLLKHLIGDYLKVFNNPDIFMDYNEDSSFLFSIICVEIYYF